MKRAAWIVLALAVVVFVARGQAASSVSGTRWTCSVDDVADGLALCIAAPEPGQRRYITDIIAQSTTATAGLFQLQYNTTTAAGGAANCGDGTGGTTLIPPGKDAGDAGRYAAAGNTARATVIRLSPPIIVPAGQDLCALGDATNSITIQISGYVAP